MFGELLKIARKNKKYSQDDLAKLLGVSRVTITNYELGNNTPTHSNLKKLVEALGVPYDYFESGNKTTVSKVPIRGEASCGSAIINGNQEYGKTCNYNGEYFHSDLYCVIACGDSMSPEIEDGDEIICDPRVKPIHGDLVHYTIYGESAVKLYVIDEDAHILQFVPYNLSNDFKVRTIRLDDEEEVSDLVVTKVVSVNKLKFNNRSARLKLIGR